MFGASPPAPSTSTVTQRTEADKREALRLKGNTHFKAKDYGEALTLYTQAMVVCKLTQSLSGESADGQSADSKLFTNRAMCYKALEMFAMAASDAKTALKLSPNSVKAWFLVGECGFLKCKHSTDDNSEEIIKESVSCLLKGRPSLHEAGELDNTLEEGNSNELIKNLLNDIFATLPQIIALSRKYQSQKALTFLAKTPGLDVGILTALEASLNDETDKNEGTGRTFDMFSQDVNAEPDAPSHLCCPITMVEVN